MGIKTAIKMASGLTDRVVPPPDGIAVLIYHRVGGGSDSAVDLEPAVFDEQLAYLTEHHRLISLDEAIDEVARARPAGDDRRAVVITFDDGTDDWGEHVVPALAKHNAPATFYVATQFVDEQTEFPWGAAPASWSSLRDAAATGLVTLASHTHSHALLDRLDPLSLDEDLDRSIDLIGEHTGQNADHFAYPKALPGSPTAEVAVRRRFRSASLGRSRVNRYGSTDPHRLWRTPIQASDTIDDFAAKADGGSRLEGELRAISARVRYRNASN